MNKARFDIARFWTLKYNQIKLRLGYECCLSRWSPGDGWTRYSITSVDGGTKYTPEYNLREIEAYLRGILATKTTEL